MSRIKFIAGIVIVIALVLGLTVYLNNSMSTASSEEAELAADASSIGTNFAGLISDQLVEEGDAVEMDQELFRINSADLKQALADESVERESLPFDLDDEDNIVLRATDDGVIDEIRFREGSFAPAGGIIGTINTAGSLHAVAEYRLSPPDYARINRGGTMEITLPDNSKVEAAIFDIALVNNEDTNRVDTVVKARIPNADVTDFRISVGTPVDTKIELTRDAWYDGFFRFIEQLFRPARSS